jgi:hypothetical protein
MIAEDIRAALESLSGDETPPNDRMQLSSRPVQPMPDSAAEL